LGFWLRYTARAITIVRHDDAEHHARLRPQLKPIVLAIVANLLFGGALLGAPYVRGRERARESTEAFAGFASCLFEARVAEDPGLSLPRGERARFATIALEDDPRWPAKCERSLASVEHAPADFLFPAVKGAEEEVRVAVRLLRRELRTVARRRASGRVPRPVLDALARVQAALALLVSGPASKSITREATSCARAEAISSRRRSRQPGCDRWPPRCRAEDGVLVTDDRRAIAHVGGGREGTRATRHPRLAASFRRAGAAAIWSTGAVLPGAYFRLRPRSHPLRRSASAVDVSAQRDGLAAFTEDRQRLAPFAWLRAHSVSDHASVDGSTASPRARRRRPRRDRSRPGGGRRRRTSRRRLDGFRRRRSRISSSDRERSSAARVASGAGASHCGGREARTVLEARWMRAGHLASCGADRIMTTTPRPPRRRARGAARSRRAPRRLPPAAP
jgi:hypothetical protein